MKGETDKMVVIIRYIGEVWAGVRGVGLLHFRSVGRAITASSYCMGKTQCAVLTRVL